jgi:predicted dehydrogenase
MKTALTPKICFERPYADDPVRMVVVGLGMGKNRCKQIEETNGIRLYGVCDINEEKAKAVGEMYGVPYSTDINTFLNDPAVEVMYIVTPTGTHCDIAMQCFEAGKHVLTTKPMDVSYQKCDKAIAMAKEKGLMFGVDFDLHFRGPLSELQNAVKGGFFGKKITSANIILNIRRTQKYYDENGKWRGTWAMDGGGALSNQGIHEIDRLITILGIPDEVRTITSTQTFNIEAEDYGVTEWRYKNGTTARFSVTTSYFASSWYARVEVYGPEGAYLNVSGGPEGNHIYWYKDGKWTEDAPFPYQREWQQGSDNFAYCLRMGSELVVSAEDGRNARYVLDKMYESVNKDGAWVTVAESNT